MTGSRSSLNRARAATARALLIATGASWLYQAASLGLTRHVLTAPRRRFATARANPGAVPAVSMLKPVRGHDHEALENFASFLAQDYPARYEVIFAVADPDDPAVETVRRLQAQAPGAPVRLVVSPTDLPNPKVALLAAAAAEARHDILLVSDSDMRVTPDYLRRVVAPLDDPAVGLVTCPYRGSHLTTLTARLEALYMVASFIPMVATARLGVGFSFALGSTAALRKSDLERIGGFAALGDYLADDHELGARIGSQGKSVHLSDYVVETPLGPTTFPEQWHREVRWARCNWVSRRREYLAAAVTFTTPLSLAYAVVAGPRRGRSWRPLALSVVGRWMVAWLVTGYAGDREARRWLGLLPLRDMLSGLIWAAAALGRKVEWRGERYRVDASGRLQPLGRD